MSTDQYCDRFDERLLDLLYGELGDEEASSLRAHAAVCERCGAALAELELDRSMFQMADEAEPPPGLDAPLLQQAAQQAANWSSEPEVSPPALQSSWLDRAQQVFDRLVGVARHPAFVSASVVVVITVVAVSIYRQGGSFQFGPLDEEPGAPALSQTGAEKSPSAPARSAPPKSDKGAPQPPAPAAADAPAEVSAEKQLLTEQRDLLKASRRRARGVAPQAEKKEAPKSRPAAKKRSKRAAPSKKVGASPDALDDLLGGASGAGASPPAQRQQAKPSAKHKSSASDAARFAPAPTPSASARAEFEDAELGALEEAAAPRVDSRLEEGTNAYRRGDCATAESLLGSMVMSTGYSKSQRSEASFMLGECARRRGRCSAAIIHYDELLRIEPNGRRAPEALYNAAVCHRRLGQNDRAAEQLHRLMQFSSWKERADTLLKSLEAR